MKQPYENVYLGNFIFALGYQAAQTNKGVSNKAVQLVQQTPDEEILNDLFINWGGKNFIFEFKRNVKKVSTELDKPAKVKLNKALNSPSNILFSNLSEKAHFLGFGFDEGIGFIPYMNIEKPIEKCFFLNSFCELLLDANNGLGLTYDEFSQYLNFIRESTSSTTEGCGGFVFNVSEDGSLNMVPFDSVDVLAQTLDVKPEPPRPAPRPTFSPGM
ncbi:hypothetical protein [uncultured Shewanella sp.]|uniref:hypothetical protein n=1 Tax=uncultured Shewanella sp. TaxID=173975 RepID=UPI00260D47DE|nr:hypothetical protein [uncultured Shewanella sp.]